MKYVFLYVICMTILTFVMYGVDKYKAKHNAWRISEKVLLLLAFMGGGLGAYGGMIFFHHKTKHMMFRILVPISVIMWLVIAISIHYFVQ